MESWFILRWQVEVTFQEARAHFRRRDATPVVQSGNRPHHAVLVCAVLDRDPVGRATRPARMPHRASR
jgi:hypothetical protein